MATSGIKLPIDEIHAARVPRDGQEHLCASIAVGAQLKLQVLDAHGGAPVEGASARRIEIEGGDGNLLPCPDDAGFELPFPPPPYEPTFGDADEKRLAAAVKALEELATTSTETRQKIAEALQGIEEKTKAVDTRAAALPKPAKGKKAAPDAELMRLKKELAEAKATHKKLEAQRAGEAKRALGKQKERDDLVGRRQRRIAWVRYVQSALRAFSRWDGAIDGVYTPEFERALTEGYQKIFDKVYSVRRNAHLSLTGELYKKLQGRFVTDALGVLTVGLPAAEKGSVTVELSHLKLLSPDDAANFDPKKQPPRAEYRGGTSGTADVPSKSPPELSDWHLVQGERSAPFRNFLSIPFDTTKQTKGAPPPIEKSTYALVWCQPAWTPAGEKGYVLEDGDATSRLSNGRGLKDGHPTLLVSASKTRRGRNYGVFGKEGRAHPAPDLLMKLELGLKWYTWDNTFVHESTHLSESEARSQLEFLHPGFIERFEREVVFVPTGIGLVPGFPTLTRSVFFDTWQIVRVRVVTEHETEADADRALANRDGVSSGDKRLIEKALTADGKPEWYVLRPNDKDLRFYRSGPFTTFKDALADFVKKMHHGIDVAGNVGDPVFAACGGRVTLVKNQPKGGGLFVTVEPWLQAAFKAMQFLHNSKFECGAQDVVKAGDILSRMGRTGNPDDNSPTHVHFQCFSSNGRHIDHTDLPAGVNRVVFPFNGLPKLLPCEADWGSRENADTKTCARHCGLKEGDKNANRAWADCWANLAGQCPHAPPPPAPGH